MKEIKNSNVMDSLNAVLNNEVVLWQGNPRLKHILRAEKRIIIISLCGILAISSSLFTSPHGVVWVIAKILVFSPLYTWLFFQLLRWPFRKKYTHFILTETKACIVYRKGGKWIVITKPFEEIYHCDVQKGKNCCHIYLGDYQFNWEVPYSYRSHKIESIEYKYKDYSEKFIYDQMYFSFFDLDDCTLPAQIIRDQMMIKQKHEERDIVT